MKISTNIEPTSIDLLGVINSETIENLSNENISNLSTKVDKITNKGLSTNDFSDNLKTKLDGIEAGAEVNVNSDWTASNGKSQILNKPDLTVYVEKVTNYGLSQNDFTNILKTKLDGIANYADLSVKSDWNATTGKAEILNKPIIVDSNLFVEKVTGKALSTNDFTDTLKTKLDGIEPGAEVNVNSDWNASSGDAQILNKPTLLTLANVKNDSQISDVISKVHVQETAESIGLIINNSDVIVNPSDLDNIGIADNVSGGFLKKISWNNLKNALRLYFNSLYTITNLGGVPNTRTVNLKQLNNNIILNKTDIGLSNVDNTSDLAKPVSTAVQTAINNLVISGGGTLQVYKQESLNGTINGINTNFTTSQNFKNGTTKLFVNGIKEKNYTEISNNQVNLSFAPSNIGFEDSLIIEYEVL